MTFSLERAYSRRPGVGSARRTGFRGIGGGGGAPAFVPSDLSGCIADCIADSAFITLVGGKVDTWDDRSVQNNSPVQATDASRPVIATVGGKDYVEFGVGGLTFMAVAAMSGFSSAAPSMTIAIAVRWVTVTGTWQELIQLPVGSGASRQIRSLVANNRIGAQMAGAAADPGSDASNGLVARYIARSNSVATTGTARLRYNGTDYSGSGSTNTSMGTTTPQLSIGSRLGTFGRCNVRVRGFSIFNREVTNDEAAQLDAYYAAEMP